MTILFLFIKQPSTWAISGPFFVFFWLFAATQLALKLHQERTQVVCPLTTTHVWRNRNPNATKSSLLDC